MFASLKLCLNRFALFCLAIGLISGSASAITVELAKKCDALTALAFPPRVPGNPAAGSEKGSGRQMQDYFKNAWKMRAKCQRPASQSPASD